MYHLWACLFLLTAGVTAQTVYWETPNGKGAKKFSSLDDINKGNIANLALAWEYAYETPWDISDDFMEEQGEPIVIEDGAGRDILVTCAPYKTVIAVDPATGEEIWVNHDAVANVSVSTQSFTCRGVATWLDSQKQQGEHCRRMLYSMTHDKHLMALDAATGTPCTEFGTNGFLDVGHYNIWGDFYVYMVNYPTVIGDVLSVTESIWDGAIFDVPKGQIPGWDCRTGEELWRFFIVPVDEDDPAMATWTKGTEGVGAGNCWIPLGGDEELGLFYGATSSPGGEHMGIHRPGDNHYTTGVLALNATTGKVVWFQQLVHHNLWDYDVNSTPVRADLMLAGVRRKVVMQLTKMGFLFIFDAETGEAVFEIEERHVRQSTVPGEQTSPTQPFPKDDFLRLARRYTINMTEGADLWGRDQASLVSCSIKAAQVDPISNVYDPPQMDTGKMMVPGVSGGGGLGGVSVDEDRAIAVMVINEAVAAFQILPRYTNSSDIPSWCTSHRQYPAAVYDECVTFGFNDEEGTPCVKPPWAGLVAVNLDEKRELWNVPFGQTGAFDTSFGQTFVAGGVLLTGGGLVFTTNNMAGYTEAYDIDTGERLWQSLLIHFGIKNHPITYKINGEQYIVVTKYDSRQLYKYGRIWAFKLY